MKTFATGLLVLVVESLHAQALFLNTEPDTLLHVFAMSIENDAYEAALHLPKACGVDTGVVSVCPLAVRFWSTWQGWDVVVFDLEQGQTFGYHYDFSGEYSDNVNKQALLRALAKKKAPD
jgi:hypothetical protein